jgi:hypothetical protein
MSDGEGRITGVRNKDGPCTTSHVAAELLSSVVDDDENKHCRCGCRYIRDLKQRWWRPQERRFIIVVLSSLEVGVWNAGCGVWGIVSFRFFLAAFSNRLEGRGTYDVDGAYGRTLLVIT